MGNEETREGISRSEYEELRERVREAEERLHKGDITLALIDKHLENIDTKLGEVSLALATLKDKPAQRWESIVTQVLSWAVALLLGYIALRLK